MMHFEECLTLLKASCRRVDLAAYALFASFFVAACSDSSSTAGATSETTNGIAIRVVDAAAAPLTQARVALYGAGGTRFLQAAEADSLGEARFDYTVEGLDSLCGPDNCFVEGVSGADSSLMTWAPLAGETREIALLPSASIRVRTGAAVSDSMLLAAQVALAYTPYVAQLQGSEYVFTHVPAGKFALVADSPEMFNEGTQVSLDPGQVLDTLVAVPGVSKEVVFEDFDDGDKVNNLVSVSKGYGWYLISQNGVAWQYPDSGGNVVEALDTAGAYAGYSLRLEFNLGESGVILLGTHLGADSTYFDLSRLSALRLKLRGDAKIGVALEHYQDVGDNKFRKAYWRVDATEEWTEVVLRPGEESLDSASYNVSFDEVSTEIALFSVFVFSGTRLQIDEIVFEGMEIGDFVEKRP